MRQIFTLFLFVACSSWALSQEVTQSIKGKILDVTTNEPVIGATIRILNTEPLKGGVTDVNGEFEIEHVPVGRHDVQVTFVGYEPVTYTGILVTSAKPFLLDVQLKSSVESLGEVVVRANNNNQPLNQMAKVSARSFSIEEAQRFAGGMSDPSRVAYNFPGVTFGNAQDNGVVVRGNSPVNVLWRIEGVEVPGASHFGGGNLAGAGLITIYSANVLGTSDFLTGAFPAEFGNATAGVFDLNFRNGTTDDTKYTAQVGILGADIAVEGPLRKGGKGSYLANYRHGFIGYYGELAGGASPHYQDFSFKVNLPTTKHGTFSVWGMGGLSSIFTPYRKYEEDEDGIKQRETESDFFQDDIAFDMGVIGFNHKIVAGKKAFITTSLATTTSGYNSSRDRFLPQSSTSNTGVLKPHTSTKGRETKHTLTSAINYQLAPKIYTTAGVIFDYIGFNYQAREAQSTQAGWVEFLDVEGSTAKFQSYAQSDFTLTPQLSVQAGVNVHHFALNQETTVEPRAGLKWKPASRLTFGLGYGLNSRREEPKVYFFEYETANGETRNHESLKRKKAHHYVASVNYDFTPTLRVQVEVYYQDLFDVPVVPDSSYSFVNYTQLWNLDAPLTNEGTGTNKGVDLTLEQSFNKSYYYLLTASFFDAKYVGGDGVERNSVFNRGFLTTLTAGKEFTIRNKKKERVNLLGINFNVTYMGGQRTTPFLLPESRQQQDAVLDYNRLYSKQIDPEIWINAGATYKINKEKSTVTWGIDFQNATLNQQFQGYEYNFVNNDVQEKRVLFLLPNFYYKIEF